MPRTASLIALCLVIAAAAAAQEGGAVRREGIASLDVPFVSQDEWLCGGAAAAMLLRAAGVRGVYANDFASLVDRAAGGIRTRELQAALERQGHLVRAWSGAPALARERLAARQPVLALLEDRPGRYHYVVLVGWTAGVVAYHDPARAPFMQRDEDEFDRAWSRAGRWMLVVEGVAPPPPSGPSRPSAPLALSSGSHRATSVFVERNYREAARLAEDTLRTDPADIDSWRLLGASRYLIGDLPGALDAWNHAGGPRVDLVRMNGLVHTPHHVVEQLIGIEPGGTLTRYALARAGRRASLLPSQQVAHVTYRALPGNLAEVHGAIVERDRFPSRTQWLFEAVRLPIDRELGASFSNVATAGDRLSAAWRFWEGRPRAVVTFAFPSRGGSGVWTLGTSWQQERYSEAPLSETRHARVGWTNWVTARLRVEGGAGMSRRRDPRGVQAVLDVSLEYRPLSDALAFEAEGTAAPGAAPFTTGTAAARWRRKAGALRLNGGVSFSKASALAPLDRWPGAGTGHARPLLLRAHPLLDGGVINGEVFGRAVLQSTIEAERDVISRGLFAAGVAAFADAARSWQRIDGSASPLHVDVGLGLRLGLAPGRPTIRIDVARGLADGRTALSAGWQIRWSGGKF